MVFFTVMFHVLIWALGIGAALAVLIYVPTFLYVIPYTLWIGKENTMGRQQDKKKESYWHSVHSATKLYRAWIHHQKPNL